MINLKVNAVDQPVVVTRPLAQAQGLAERVRANGRHAVIFPLLEIHPVTDPGTLKAALAQLEHYALVAFVSPNAIGAAFAARPDWPLQVPLAVMGEGSRHALAQFGVTDATTTIFRPSDVRNTDSLTLFAELDLAALKGREVLIIRGDGGREFLADALRSAGVNVTQIAAYRRQAPVLDAARRQDLQNLLAQSTSWMITSSEALHILLKMAQEVGGAAGLARLQAQKLIVPHRRIAETAQNCGFNDVLLSGSGDELMLAALQF